MNIPVAPLDVRHLFPRMRRELLRVLKNLTDAQWKAPTACAGWSVRDVAQHIWADDCGYISGHRDKDSITFVTDDWNELIRLINEQNDTWVRATRRLSRTLLISLLEFTGNQLNSYLSSVNLDEPGGTVAWAGSRPVPMWLQIAREFTEQWMHHQHICEAVEVTSLKSRPYLHPALTTFVHALPRTYAATPAAENTVVQLIVTGEAADTWVIIREGDTWALYAKSNLTPRAVITMSDDTAWRMFTKGIARVDLEQRSQLEGDTGLGAVLLNSVAILA